MSRTVFLALHSAIAADLQSEAAQAFALYRRGVICHRTLCERIADLLVQS